MGCSVGCPLGHEWWYLQGPGGPPGAQAPPPSHYLIYWFLLHLPRWLKMWREEREPLGIVRIFPRAIFKEMTWKIFPQGWKKRVREIELNENCVYVPCNFFPLPRMEYLFGEILIAYRDPSVLGWTDLDRSASVTEDENSFLCTKIRTCTLEMTHSCYEPPIPILRIHPWIY